jgi:PAS domain S-box-containing protein
VASGGANRRCSFDPIPCEQIHDVTQPSKAGSTYLGLGQAGVVALLGGGTALAAYAALAPSLLADIVFVAVSLASAAAVFVGMRRGRPIVRRAWFAIGLAVSLLAVGNLLSAIARPVPALAPIADVLYLAAYFPLFIAAYTFGRGVHRADGTTFLDSGIIGIASIPLVWELLVEPRVPAATPSADTSMALAMPVIAVVLVSLAAPVLYVRASRSPSALLLVAGLAMMGVGDSMFALSTFGDAPGSPLVNLAWLASYLLLGVSALVPSARQLGATREPNPGRRDFGRLAVLAAALLVLPILTIHETLNSANGELMVYAALALAGSGLLILRIERTLAQLASVDQRFRAFMRNDRFIAVIKDRDGRYIYRNRSAGPVQQRESDWYGRTDAELFSPEVAAALVAADAEVRRDRSRLVGTQEQDGRVFHTERFALAGRGGDVGMLAVDITERVRAEESVRFQARLLDAVRDLVIVINPEQRITYWNRAAEEILGYRADEMLGETMDRFIAPGTDDALAAAWARIASGEADAFEWRARRRDGSTVWLDVKVAPLTGADGAPNGFLGVAKDVTTRKEAELQLARLGAAIDHATDAVVVTDEAGTIAYVNPAFEELTGFSTAETVGRAPSAIPGGESFARALAKARSDNRGWRGDVVTWRRDGSDLISETSISPIAVADGPVQGHVTIWHDVTRERTAGRIADRQARERALIAETLGALRTGVEPEETARAVCEQLVKLPEVAVTTLLTFARDGIATVLTQAQRDGGGTSRVAIPAARSAYLHERAIAGPWVEHWTPEPTHPYAQQFEDLGIMAHAYAPIVVDGEPIGLLITGSDSLDAIERMAERLPALVEFAAITATLLGGAVADRRAIEELEDQMHAVIDDGAFYPLFQPIVELSTGAVRGYEALTRFSDGTPPDVRFEQAARLGVGLALETASLEAIFQAAEHLPDGPWLNVNVSPELVLAGALDDILPGGRREVVLEVTEHQAISDYASFRAAVEPFRNRVKIAVDDAGAGFASLRHIVELAPSMVKLDRSLIAGIDRDAAREAVVAGMVRFAQAAGLALLAEGIETREELATLRHLGVQLGQGFLLGRPSTVSQATFEALTFDAAASVAARQRAGRPGLPAGRDDSTLAGPPPLRLVELGQAGTKDRARARTIVN